MNSPTLTLLTTLLSKHYKFHQIEEWLEVPLDGDVANNLIEEDEGWVLEPFKSIKSLDEVEHKEYQIVASQVAKRLKTKECIWVYCTGVTRMHQKSE